jgi:putative transposase
MCDVLGVSPSGYYDSIDRPPSARAERHEWIQQAVRQAHAESHGIYGSQKVAEVMQQREDLESACRNTVAAAMRELGLKSRVSKRFKPTTTQTDPTKQPAPNTLGRDFTADAPNRKWVTDITYLATAAGWVYLAVVVDLFSRKAVGWSIGASGRLWQRLGRRSSRRPDCKNCCTTDRGCQYTSDAYQQTLRTLGIDAR